MIAYRRAAPADRAFIVYGWAASYRESDAAGMIARERWVSVMSVEINAIIERPDCITLVAYETGEEAGVADLYGFIACDPSVPLVFYTYVRGPCRRLGIARGLFVLILCERIGRGLCG